MMDFMGFMEQLKQNPDVLEKLAGSSDGKTLLAQLDPQRLEHAVQQGQNGNYGEMLLLLKGVMSDPDGKALLQRLASQLGK